MRALPFRRPRLALTGFAALAVVLLPLGISQAQDVGGIITRFGVQQELRHQTNPGFATPANPSQTRARTGLSYAIASETRTDRLAFEASGVLEAGNNRQGRALEEYGTSVSYRRISVQSLIEASIFLRERGVDAQDLGVGIDPVTGVASTVLLDSRGQLRQSGGRLRLEFGRDAPFGGTLTLSSIDSRYRGTADPSLVDNRRDTLGLNTRLALNEVVDLTFGVTISDLREVGAARARTETFSLGTILTRPDGAWRATLSQTRTAGGERTSLLVARNLDLPTGALDIRVGAVRTIAGKTEAIGGVDWRYELPRGQITLGLERNVSGDARNQENRITRLSLGSRHTFTPTVTGQFGLSLQESRRTQAGTGTRGADLSASLRVALDADWALNSGVTHRIRQPIGGVRAESTTVFMTLRRDFETRN